MDHHEDECRTEGESTSKQDDEEAVARLQELKKSIEAKMALRQSNLNPERPDAGFLRTLDSSIKRNTAVIKKLKQINEEQRDALMDELRGVNLSKFVTEAVAAICDAKLRSSDIQAAVQICSLLHQRYKDFVPSLIQGLLKVFSPGKPGDESDADKNLKAMKKRSSLKLLLELYFVGVIEDGGIFINIIKDLTSAEQLKDRDATQTSLTLLSSFARQGRIFIGLSVTGPEIHEEFFKGLSIMADQKKVIRKACFSFYDTAAEILQSEHSSLRLMELENSKILNAKGELSDENIASYEKLRKSYDQLYRNVSSLAEALDMQPPVMPEDSHTTRVTSGEEAISSGTGKDSSVVEPIWDDEDTRAFYECLPDLRAFVPAVLLGETELKVSEQSAKSQDQPTEIVPESDKDQLATYESGEVLTDSSTLPEGESTEKVKDKEEKEKSKELDRDKEKEKSKELDREKEKEKGNDKKGENEKDKLRTLEGTNFDALLQRLPGCVSRDLIDQLTVEFCYLNSKSNRKKLVRALFNVPRTSLELLPYYSRMVATLSTCMKDVNTILLQMLEEEFNFLINKKDQMNIETKIRNIRFIGELCKFKIAPASFVFSCLKACLDDFTHHNIDVACNLLETCGRFLYRSPETTIRMTNMLEILMRLKNVKNLDPRHSTSVENAYYLCKPPERSARVAKVRPPLHQYIRKLLFSDLDKSTIEHVLRQLRKLPWSECEPYILKCFMKVHKGKYGHIHLLASLAAGLSRYHDEFAVSIVDEVLEEIRLGLELNDYGMQQRRIAYMRFLGELYNYEHVDSSVIFETLYLILIYGHGTPEQDVLDPPEDCFRIRLIVTLLETCGHYFDRGSSKRKLDRFLIHFQRYILSKGALPLDVEFDLQDMFADLRPNMVRYTFIEEVNAALVELEEHDRTVSVDKASREKHSETEKPPRRISSKVAVGDRQSIDNGAEENGVQDDANDSETDSQSDTVDVEGHDDEELDEENHEDGCETEDDDDDGPGPASDYEDEVHVRHKMTEVDPLEEANFDQELKALVKESMEERSRDLRGRPTLNMMIPINVLEGSTKDHHGKGISGESGDEALDDESGGNKEVQVRVLVKRGNKQQTKQMFIPQNSSLVQSTKQKEAAELQEKEDIKRRVLEYNDREEEELNGLGTQPSNWLQSGGSKAGGRGHTFEGTSGRGGGSRHRHHNYYTGSGLYYSRRR
ncbi:putative up-frameshift suppressor 2 [Lupinus albus]|uniref:Putative up-frameshift suppressor 2 n=1 Tax=Lupinus albus TaxID=3870 RepID=A0A6A4Q483_LUPAL|nr:putative up-frameshift suppressor 2 [Lupinus albus]